MAVLAATARERSHLHVTPLLRWTGDVVPIVVCVLLAFPLFAYFFGYRTFVVTGGSMEPHASPGDAMIIRPTHDVSVGDVITFRPKTTESVTTHRVVGTFELEDGRYFRTKGDANPAEDAKPVRADRVLGVAKLRLPWIGSVYAYTATRRGALFIIVIPALVIARGAWRTLRSSRPRNHPPRRPSRSPAGFGRRAGVFLGTLLTVLAIAGPALGLFVDSVNVGSNSFATSQVNAPTLDSATSGPVAVLCRVDLGWSAPSSGLGPDGYDVYRSTVSGGPYTFIKHVGTVTSTTDTDAALDPLSTYYYVLQSSLQSWRSANSNQKSVTTVVCL